jgi:hypothetical protein
MHHAAISRGVAGVGKRIRRPAQESGRAFLAAVMPEEVKELQSKWDTWNPANIKPLWGGVATDNDGAEAGARPPKKAKCTGGG